jgi:adenylate cyclase
MNASPTPADSGQAPGGAPTTKTALRRRPWPLHIAILRYVALLVTATAIAIGLSTYINTRRAAAVLAERLTHELSQRAEERAANLLQRATQALQDTRDWAADDPNFGLESDTITDDAVWRARARLFLHVLRANPEFTMVHYGDRRDHFVGAGRDERDRSFITHRWFTPAGRACWHDYYDVGRLERSIADPIPGATFHVTQRPWYEAANRSGKLSWSPVYTFAGARTPGVTAALPNKNAAGQVIGVFGIDFELRGLNAFVRKLERERGYHVYLLSEDGRVVAQSDPQRTGLQIRQTSAGVELPSAVTSRDRVLRAAYDLVGSQRRSLNHAEMLPAFSADGKRWVGSITSFSPGDGLSWQALVILPESAVQDVINENTALAFAICLAVLLISLSVAALLSVQIARPLRAFAAEMREVGDFVISDTPSPASPIVEVQMMGHALDRMKASLRSYEKYVPSEVVRMLHAQGRTAQLGGETARLTLLFADVVGFSTLAEQLEPEQAVATLSRYLALTEDIITGHGGIVDKYNGDSVIAFWDAPIRPCPSPEQDACAAALEIQRAVQALNAERQSADLPPLDVRIGIHTGDALVGNIGSPHRMNYTAVGDAVNVASRLEQLNRTYGTRIMVSEVTLRPIAHEFTTRELDVVALKGRKRGIGVYELLEPNATEPQKQLCRLYAEGLRLYRLRHWEQAATSFHQGIDLAPDDAAFRLMADRCAHYARSQPPADWTGIYVASAK